MWGTDRSKTYATWRYALKGPLHLSTATPAPALPQAGGFAGDGAALPSPAAAAPAAACVDRTSCDAGCAPPVWRLLGLLLLRLLG